MIFWAIILFTWVFQTRLRIAKFEPRFLRFSKNGERTLSHSADEMLLCGFFCGGISLTLGALDRLRCFIVTLPGPSI